MNPTSLSTRDHVHPPKKAQVFKTGCKPKCSLWVFSDCPKLIFDFQMAVACFLIIFGRRRGLVKWTLSTRDPVHPSKKAQVFKTGCRPKCSLWVFSDCPKLVFDFQVVVTCFLIIFGRRGLVLWTLSTRDPDHPPKKAQVFKTRCKPECGLWVFGDCSKLIFGFQVVVTCFLIIFGRSGPGIMNFIYKRSCSSTQKSSSFQNWNFELQVVVTCFLLIFGRRGLELWTFIYGRSCSSTQKSSSFQN
jgi:hypothetical protein